MKREFFEDVYITLIWLDMYSHFWWRLKSSFFVCFTVTYVCLHCSGFWLCGKSMGICYWSVVRRYWKSRDLCGVELKVECTTLPDLLEQNYAGVTVEQVCLYFFRQSMGVEPKAALERSSSVLCSLLYPSQVLLGVSEVVKSMKLFSVCFER